MMLMVKLGVVISSNVMQKGVPLYDIFSLKVWSVTKFKKALGGF
jgi:hypothetical protein